MKPVSEKPTGRRRPAGVRVSATYLPELESLRGIAALLVFFFHADGCLRLGSTPIDAWPSLPLAFLRAGHTGVSLFFVLSAFLLSQPFLAEAAGGRRVPRANFYRRRALRILPLYYAMVVLATGLSAESVADLLDGVPYLFFLEAVSGWVEPLGPFSYVWWSLATEVQFYLLLPFLPLLMGRRALFGWAALALYALAYWMFVVGTFDDASPSLERFLREGLLGRGTFFLFGICGAWWYQHYAHAARARMAASRVWRRGGADLLLLSVILAQGTLLRWVVYTGLPSSEGPWLFAWHLLEGLLWTAVVLLLLVAPLRAKPLLFNRGLTWVGVVSYSLYVIHLPLLTAWLKLTHDILPSALGGGWTVLGAVWASIALVLCLGLSAITYRTIELPFLKRKVRFD